MMNDTQAGLSLSSANKEPHPIVWLILYIPFGAMFGFVSVALTFVATQHGLSITEGSLLIASQMLVNWMKWLWAPVVDITLTPKKWYVISTVLSGLSLFAMTLVPMEKEMLALIILIQAAAGIINSVVGMSVEALIATVASKEKIGSISAWFQAGNLGGTGLGGALGLYLMQHLPKVWMSGAIVGTVFVSCCLALIPLPHVKGHAVGQKPVQAVKSVAKSFWEMIRERVGFMTAVLCILPIGTGAAQGVLTQAGVAGFWHAGADQVELVQGLLSGFITMFGCFIGGWFCDRMDSRRAYAIFGIVMAIMTLGMAVSPATLSMYVGWNMLYCLSMGLSYAAFSAMSLIAVGRSAAATGYNVFASLSNFPIWWLGLLLAWVADHRGPRTMLVAESVFGVLGVLVFLFVESKLVSSTEKTVSAETAPASV